MYDNSIQDHEAPCCCHVHLRLRRAHCRDVVRQRSTRFTHRTHRTLHPLHPVSTMDIHPLRPRDHEDAARVAISWLAERHRKGWRNAFEEAAGPLAAKAHVTAGSWTKMA